MNGLQALTTLLEHAERQRDAALSELRNIENNMRGSKAQFDQLLDYRQDYQRRWSTEFGRQGNMEIVNCYHGFVGRLGMAIDQQEQVAIRARNLHEAALVKMREHETRVASIGKLIERRLQEARRTADQRDQKLTDEMAARLAWTRLQNPGSAANA